MNLLLRSLATWRLTRFFLYELGPYEIGIKLRELFGIKHDEDGNVAEFKYYWTRCFLCCSFWIGIVSSFLPQSIIKLLVINSIAIFLEDWYDGSSKD